VLLILHSNILALWIKPFLSPIARHLIPHSLTIVLLVGHNVERLLKDAEGLDWLQGD
jgi:hypothetical protein